MKSVVREYAGVLLGWIGAGVFLGILDRFFLGPEAYLAALVKLILERR